MKIIYQKLPLFFVVNLLIVSFLMLSCNDSLAQGHKLTIGTQVPTSHYLGYEYEFKNGFTTGGQIGLLTSPYGELFNEMMEKWGMDENVKSLLNEAFTYAWVFQPNMGYTINEKYHVEVFGQYIYSSSDAPPLVSFLPLLDTSVDPGIIDQLSLESDLRITGQLFQVGAILERRFQLKNPKWEFRLGVGFSSNIRSRNIIDIKQTGGVQIAQETIDLIVDATNEEIRTNYLKYAHIPVVNFKFVRKLGGE